MLALNDEIWTEMTTPEFEGITFHEVLCKSALNKLPESSAMPFSWTVNPYRGCTHACTYCFARSSHEYLEFDAGGDFDSQIVVKVNVASVLARTLVAMAATAGVQVLLSPNTVASPLPSSASVARSGTQISSVVPG